MLDDTQSFFPGSAAAEQLNHVRTGARKEAE